MHAVREEERKQKTPSSKGKEGGEEKNRLEIRWMCVWKMTTKDFAIFYHWEMMWFFWKIQTDRALFKRMTMQGPKESDYRSVWSRERRKSPGRTDGLAAFPEQRQKNDKDTASPKKLFWLLCPPNWSEPSQTDRPDTMDVAKYVLIVVQCRTP